MEDYKKFRPGDRILRIGKTLNSSKKIKKGEIYTFKKYGNNVLSLHIEESEHDFFSKFFKLAGPQETFYKWKNIYLKSVTP